MIPVPKPEPWVRRLAVLAVLLIALDLAGLAAKFLWHLPADRGWVWLFDLDAERNVPSLFSTALILLSAGLFGRIALASKQRSRDDAPWAGLAVLFGFLALDELVSLHERLIEPLRDALHTSGILYFAWVIPYGLAVLVIGALYLKFLFRLPRATRRGLCLAGSVYLAGALGLELIGGGYLETLGGRHNLPYELLTALEESLEMFGMILLARTLLVHLGATPGAYPGIPAKNHCQTVSWFAVKAARFRQTVPNSDPTS